MFKTFSIRHMDFLLILAVTALSLIGVAAIGSGGMYALAAAKALLKNTQLTAAEIAEKSLRIAGEICIFTNDHITVEGF